MEQRKASTDREIVTAVIQAAFQGSGDIDQRMTAAEKVVREFREELERKFVPIPISRRGER